MRSVLSRAYGYQLQNFYQLRNSQKSNFVKMMKLRITFCRQESSGRCYQFHSFVLEYLTKIFVCIDSFSWSIQAIFEIQLINCLRRSISHWFSKITFKVFLGINFPNSYWMPALIFTLRIKHHESRILSDWNSLGIPLYLLRRSWR